METVVTLHGDPVHEVGPKMLLGGRKNVLEACLHDLSVLSAFEPGALRVASVLTLARWRWCQEALADRQNRPAVCRSPREII
jgi:hypothetical protein